MYLHLENREQKFRDWHAQSSGLIRRKILLFYDTFEAQATVNVKAVFNPNSWQIDLNSATLSVP